MTGSDLKADLRRYLQEGREALLWKLDGLSEYDIRRPLVLTGTNLLGLIKHQAGAELAYFGDTFGRPCSQDQLPWDEADPNSDMWATPQNHASSSQAGTAAPGRIRMPRSTRSRWTPSATCRGGHPTEMR